MRWTLPELHALPVSYYRTLIAMLTEEADRAQRT
jgi:hypothetical protein